MSGYVMVPGWLREARPSANAIWIYVTLASYGTFHTATGTYEECRPALATIAEDSGLSESTIKRAIAELLDLRAIERRQRLSDDGRTSLPSVYRVIFGTLSGPPGSTGDPRGGSTGDPRGGPPVTRDQEPDTKNPDTKKSSASPRGTRLPPDWKPSAELIEWARTNAPGVGWSEHEQFVDYWIAQPGQKGSKTDWPATWRNWMRREAQRSGTRPTSGAPVGQYKSAAVQNAELRERSQRRAQLADQIHEERGIPVPEAFELAKQIMDGNPVDSCRTVGYIDGEITQTALPSPEEVTPDER